MYLTRFTLNARRRGARKLIGSPQAMHAAIMAGFPKARTDQRPLWRMDDDADPMRPTVFVVSGERIDVTHIEEQAGWPVLPTAKTAPYEQFLSSLSVGQHWAFRLNANPTHRARIDGDWKVVAHVTADQQVRWLLERSEELGIQLESDDGPTFAVTKRQTLRFRRSGGQVTLGTARFEGRLAIQDPEKLRSALERGIGRAKAYGCGLMTLAKL